MGKGHYEGKSKFIVNESHNQQKESIMSNAEAIIRSVNSTWLKNINPEAVPELLECLIMAVQICKAEGWSDSDNSIQKMKAAIEKATI